MERIKADLLLQHADLLIPDAYHEPIEDGALVINGNLILDFGKTADMRAKYQSKEIMDVSGKVLMPGLVDCHNHLGNWNLYALSAESDKPIIKQPDRLLAYVYPAYTLIEEEDCYDLNMVGYLNAIKTGSTTVSNAFIWTNEIGRAAVDTGLRVDLAPCLHQAITHPDSVSIEHDLVRTEEQIKRWHNAGNGRIQYRIQPEISFFCEEWFFKACAELGEKYKVGLGTHLAEDRTSTEKAAKIWPQGELRKLCDTGFVGKRTLFFHASLLKPDEIKLLGELGGAVAHCPVSNLKRGAVARIPEMIESGVKVGLGTDYPNNDIFNVMRLVSLIHTILSKDHIGVSERKAFDLATQGGADALGIGRDVGSIAIGKKADVITLNTHTNSRIFPLTAKTAVNLIRLNANGSDVSDMIVDGKIIMRNSRPLTCDEDVVMEKARKLQEKFITKYRKYRAEGREICPVRNEALLSMKAPLV